jgi:hypothetical protein
MGLKQNSGASTRSMPGNRSSGKAAPTKNGSKAVKFEGTHVCSDAGEGVSSPMRGDMGSHDGKTREHGGD